tara:strand:+ start:410 stop:1021 length:612 start_codon:yes stop_codon:yes gene_type:complete
MSLPLSKEKESAQENYSQVRAEIERNRLLPWGSATECLVGEFIIKPLCFRSYVDLSLAQNAILTKKKVSEGDVIAYIWRHDKEYSPTGDPSKVIEKVAKMESVTDLIKGIAKHLNDAFEEPPAPDYFSDKTEENNRLYPIPIVAGLCHEYGAAYGINPTEVADIDIRIIFQCIRARRISTENAEYLEPKRLRQAKSDFLKSYG